MAFQIKDFVSIAASMVNWMRATQNTITDFNVGSVARTLVEAPAVEIDELYQQMFNGLKEAIPVSVYNSFDFAPIVATPSSGLIRVSITASISTTIISAGTIFSSVTNANTFASNTDVIIAPGNTFADVLVTNQITGVAGNISSGLSFTAVPAISGVVSAQNLNPFINGLDTESDVDRKSRFNAFISSLKRGTTAAITYGLSLAYLTDANGNKIESVVSSSIVEPWINDNTQPIALVNCYIHNGVGNTSSALVQRARDVIYGYYDITGIAVPGWKAAGIKLNVFAAIEQALNVTGVLTALAGYDKLTLVSLAKQAVYAQIIAVGIGNTLVKAEVIRIIKSITGVYDITFPGLSDQTTTDNMTKLMPGAISIT